MKSIVLSPEISPPQRPSTSTVYHHLNAVLQALVVSFISLSSLACDDDAQSVNELLTPMCGERGIDEEGRCLPRLTPAHPPQCLEVDGELCLIEFTWQDGPPRIGALTPGEVFSIETVSLFNSGDEAVNLSVLLGESVSPDLILASSWVQRDISGSAWVNPDMPLNAPAQAELENRCTQAELPPGAGCTFPLGIQLKIDGSAPVNATQRFELATETQRGARFSWSLPLVVVDPVEGLDLVDYQFTESTEDGELQRGDRIHLTEVTLVNSTFAPFVELTGLLVTEGDTLTLEGEPNTEWEIGDQSVSGVHTSVSTCLAAQSTDELGLLPGRCTLNFDHIWSISPDRDMPPPRLTLFLRDRGVNVGDPIVIEFDLQERSPRLALASLVLNSDENRDRALSPGERFSLNQLVLENESDESISLRGRVLSDGTSITLSSSSDLSINETRLRDQFFEHCPPLSSCPLEVNLMGTVNEDAEFGDLFELELELLDHAGDSHQLMGQMEIQRPDVQFQLVDVEIRQDTLDPDLSAGERGVMSYLRLHNIGLADAEEVLVTISTDNPHIAFEDNEDNRVSFPLNTSSEAYDDRSQCCPSVQQEPDGYCYHRGDLAFNISPDAPLGEEITFLIDVSDRWGNESQLMTSFTVY